MKKHSWSIPNEQQVQALRGKKMDHSMTVRGAIGGQIDYLKGMSRRNAWGIQASRFLRSTVCVLELVASPSNHLHLGPASLLSCRTKTCTCPYFDSQDICIMGSKVILEPVA